MMASFDDLVEICTSDYPSEFTGLWKSTCHKFKGDIFRLESKEHFESEDVDEFQLAADKFCYY